MARAIAVFTLLQRRERDSPPRYFAFLAEANAFWSEAFLAAWIHLVVKPKAGCRCRHPFRRSKPLYDFALDCQACQAKLSAAQSDLADEKTKTAALTKERDDALHVAKGGSAWRWVTRAAKWFLLGAAAGAVVPKAH